MMSYVTSRMQCVQLMMGPWRMCTRLHNMSCRCLPLMTLSVSMLSLATDDVAVNAVFKASCHCPDALQYPMHPPHLADATRTLSLPDVISCHCPDATHYSFLHPPHLAEHLPVPELIRQPHTGCHLFKALAGARRHVL